MIIKFLPDVHWAEEEIEQTPVQELFLQDSHKKAAVRQNTEFEENSCPKRRTHL